MTDTDLTAGGTAGPVHDRTGRPALRRCTGLDPDRFAAEVWGRRPCLSRAADLPPGPDGRPGFGDLFDLAAVDTLVGRQGLRTPFLRVARDGVTLPASRFTRGGGVGATVGDQVADDALARLFADGCTIVLQGLHRVWSPVVDFAQALTADLGHPVQVNAYITPPQSQGFSAHYDVHDVFVLQVAGEKHWTIHAPVREAPLRDEPWTDRRDAVRRAADARPLLDVTLRPGDALYLPRGHLHAAKALGGTSAHLTVGIHPWTRTHLVEQVLHGLGRPDAAVGLRAPLPLGVDVTDPASIEAELATTVALLRQALADVRAQDVAHRLERLADGASRAAPVGPMAQALAVAGLTPQTALRWRPYLRARLEGVGPVAGPDAAHRGEATADAADAADRTLVIRTPEATVRLPADARDVVERLLAGEVLTAAETGPDVARALLRDALAVPA